jgi:riboflavin kinase/FMN adenylyltransferase
VKLIRDLAELPAELRSGAVAIGNFDGVHLGHARIVERLVAHARAVRGRAVVLTFDPHPVRILRPDKAPPPLTWTDRKAQLLAELGVDSTVVLGTDEALLDLTAERFFQQIVRERLDARALVEGPNFYFGRGRQGTIDVLRAMTSAAGIELEVVEPVVLDGELVSSSRVRALIANGEVDRAARMLTHPYRIRGMVAHGAGRGIKLGFPTANVEAIDTLLPAAGVYAGLGLAPTGDWPAAINIGPNPTFGEHVLKVEAHLIGCHEPLYGQPLEIDFLARIREVRTFPGIDALKQQLHEDVASAAQIADDWQRARG